MFFEESTRSAEEGSNNVLDESTTSGDATPTESTTTDTTDAINTTSDISSKEFFKCDSMLPLIF